MFIHGNKTCGNMSMHTKVDLQNSQYAVPEKMVYKCELITMIFESNSMKEIKTNTKFKVKRIYIENLLIKFG